jgi:hypothetical protein
MITRTLVIEVQVQTEGPKLDGPIHLANAMMEGLPDEWFEPLDGDDFWLSDTFTARWKKGS